MKDDERPEGEKPKNVLAMPDPAEEARKLLAAIQANMESMARQHRTLYDEYVKQKFTPQQAIELVNGFMRAAMGNVR